MTTPSNFSQTGIAVYADPPILGSSRVSCHISLNPFIDDYNHIIEADGGYKEAHIALKMPVIDIEEWLENGLGRDITAYNEGGEVRWNGLVNDMEASIGGLTVKRGPLMGVANKVCLVYSTIDTTVTPPVLGVRKRTAYATDTDSIARYGIIEKILSCGGSTEANAEAIRDTFLQENKDAETTPVKIKLGGEGDLMLTLNCKGYQEWLRVYYYNRTTSGTIALSTRIQETLTADPNSIISTDYSHITTNAMTVPSWENDDPTAAEYIRGLVAKGDTSYNRYTFGIYDGRMAHYDPVPTEQEYIWRIGDGGQIYDRNNAIVRPWDVLPAKWAQIPDFMIGRIPVGTLMRDDPRYMFIESVEFTAPYKLTLNGAKISTLPQILGQFGLTGIGA